MKYTCPVCGFANDDPPIDHNICICCGTEFGYHTAGTTFEALRRKWLRAGARWWSPVDQRPEGWDPYVQLIEAGYNFTLNAGVATKSATFTTESRRNVEFLAA